jgi:hypothetical protein
MAFSQVAAERRAPFISTSRQSLVGNAWLPPNQFVDALNGDLEVLGKRVPQRAGLSWLRIQQQVSKEVSDLSS